MMHYNRRAMLYERRAMLYERGALSYKRRAMLYKDRLVMIMNLTMFIYRASYSYKFATISNISSFFIKHYPKKV